MITLRRGPPGSITALAVYTPPMETQLSGRIPILLSLLMLATRAASQPIEITLDDAIARAELEALVGRELE